MSSFNSLEFGLGMLSGGLGAGVSAFFTSKYVVGKVVGNNMTIIPKLSAGLLCGSIAYFVANDSPFWQGAATGASLVDIGFTFLSGIEGGHIVAKHASPPNLHYNAQAPTYNATYLSTIYKWAIPTLLVGKYLGDMTKMTGMLPFAGRIFYYGAGAVLSDIATGSAIRAAQIPHPNQHANT